MKEKKTPPPTKKRKNDTKKDHSFQKTPEPMPTLLTLQGIREDTHQERLLSVESSEQEDTFQEPTHDKTVPLTLGVSSLFFADPLVPESEREETLQDWSMVVSGQSHGVLTSVHPDLKKTQPTQAAFSPNPSPKRPSAPKNNAQTPPPNELLPKTTLPPFKVC